MLSNEKKALLIIDMLNDFVKEGGTLVVPEAKNIIEPIRRELEKARTEQIPVIYITDAHDPDDVEFKRWPAHAVENTWGGKVIDELAPQAGEYIVKKKRYSGFFDTNLEELLQKLGVTEVILTGTLTNICIYITAIDAYMRGYMVIVPRDCVASTNEEDHGFALRGMQNLCAANII